MATQTLTRTEQNDTAETKIEKLKQLYADAPELGKKALASVLQELKSQASEDPPEPIVRSRWTAPDKPPPPPMPPKMPMQGNFLAAILVVVFGFLFVTVSSRITGLIGDRKSTRLNSSHRSLSRMPSSA